jgi:hypothetical protein
VFPLKMISQHREQARWAYNGAVLEVKKEIADYFDCADVRTCGSLGVITTLEFLQHHFSQMGHRDLLVTQTYLSPQATTAPFTSRVASAAGRLRCVLGMFSSQEVQVLYPT